MMETAVEDISLLIKDITVNSYEKNSDHWVDVVHIYDPHNFYTRPTKYRTVVHKIENLKPVFKLPSVSINNIVLFNLNGDSKDCPKYARGLIRYIINKGETIMTCDIFALDYGCFRKDVPLEDVWKCDNLLLNMPPLAIKCQLAFCSPKGGSHWGEAINAFKFHVGNERAKMIVTEKTSDKLIVILYNTSPDDLATLLAITDFTTLGYIHNAINKMQSSNISSVAYYNFKELNTNTTLHVRVLSGMSLKAFYVADVNDYKKYLQETDNITYYSKMESEVDESDMKSGDLVCVKDSLNKYDRAIIKEVYYNKAGVHLVDKGREEVANVMNMRKMAKQCLTMPVVGIYCSAEENQAWNNGLPRFLYPGYEFVITIKEPGNQFESPNIVKISPLGHHTLGTKKREKRF